MVYKSLINSIIATLSGKNLSAKCQHNKNFNTVDLIGKSGQQSKTFLHGKYKYNEISNHS